MTEDDNLFMNYEIIPGMGLTHWKICGRDGSGGSGIRGPLRLPPRTGAKKPQRNGQEKCVRRLARAIRRANRAGANAGVCARDTRETGSPRRQAGGGANGTKRDGGNDMQDGDKRRFGEAGGDGRVPAEHDKT